MGTAGDRKGGGIWGNFTALVLISCGIFAFMWLDNSYENGKLSLLMAPDAADADASAIQGGGDDEISEASESLPPLRVPLEPDVEATRIEAVIEAWQPAPGSPILLLDESERASYAPTFGSFQRWFSSVDELADHAELINGLEYDRELRELWGVCLEHTALRKFIVAHGYTELDKWNRGDDPTRLADALAPARRFIDEHIGNDPSVWNAIDAYDTGVRDSIRMQGEFASVDESLRWDLFELLTDKGSASFLAIAEQLKRKSE